MTERGDANGKERDVGRAIVERAIGEAIRPSRPKRRAHPDQALNLWLGTLFFGAGVGPIVLVAIALLLHPQARGAWLVLLIVVTAFGGIALVGLNMLIQGARNRPGAEGFFYRFLARASRRVTPVHATVIPLVICFVFALEGIVTKDIIAVKLGIVLGLQWMSIFLQLFLHEVGHLLAVRRVGFPFTRLVAGPVTLWPHGRTFRLSANREWLHFITGAVYYEPFDLPTARKTLFVAAAGPIATAFIALFALAAEESFASERGSIGYQVASANVGIAASLLVLNLLPFRLGPMESDGRQIWLALRSLAGRR